MTFYIIVVLAILPGNPPPAVELSSRHIAASGPAVCQAYADQDAEAVRRAQADAVRRLSATVRGFCAPLVAPTLQPGPAL